MATSSTDFSLPPEEQPLGIQHPLLPSATLGQSMLQPKFLTPLGATPLTVLNPSVFSSQPTIEADWADPFQDAFFDVPESSQPAIAPEAASPAIQTRPLAESPNIPAEPTSEPASGITPEPSFEPGFEPSPEPIFEPISKSVSEDSFEPEPESSFEKVLDNELTTNSETSSESVLDTFKSTSSQNLNRSFSAEKSVQSTPPSIQAKPELPSLEQPISRFPESNSTIDSSPDVISDFDSEFNPALEANSNPNSDFNPAPDNLAKSITEPVSKMVPTPLNSSPTEEPAAIRIQSELPINAIARQSMAAQISAPDLNSESSNSEQSFIEPALSDRSEPSLDSENRTKANDESSSTAESSLDLLSEAASPGSVEATNDAIIQPMKSTVESPETISSNSIASQPDNLIQPAELSEAASEPLQDAIAPIETSIPETVSPVTENPSIPKNQSIEAKPSVEAAHPVMNQPLSHPPTIQPKLESQSEFAHPDQAATVEDVAPPENSSVSSPSVETSINSESGELPAIARVDLPSTEVSSTDFSSHESDRGVESPIPSFPENPVSNAGDSSQVNQIQAKTQTESQSNQNLLNENKLIQSKQTENLSQTTVQPEVDYQLEISSASSSDRIEAPGYESSQSFPGEQPVSEDSGRLSDRTPDILSEASPQIAADPSTDFSLQLNSSAAIDSPTNLPTLLPNIQPKLDPAPFEDNDFPAPETVTPSVIEPSKVISENPAQADSTAAPEQRINQPKADSFNSISTSIKSNQTEDSTPAIAPQPIHPDIAIQADLIEDSTQTQPDSIIQPKGETQSADTDTSNVSYLSDLIIQPQAEVQPENIDASTSSQSNKASTTEIRPSQPAIAPDITSLNPGQDQPESSINDTQSATIDAPIQRDLVEMSDASLIDTRSTVPDASIQRVPIENAPQSTLPDKVEASNAIALPINDSLSLPTQSLNNDSESINDQFAALPELPIAIQPLSVLEPLTQLKPLQSRPISNPSSPTQPVDRPSAIALPEIQTAWNDQRISMKESPAATPSSQPAVPGEWSSIADLFQSAEPRSLANESEPIAAWSDIAELFQSSPEAQSAPELQRAELSSVEPIMNGYAELNLYPSTDAIAPIQRSPQPTAETAAPDVQSFGDEDNHEYAPFSQNSASPEQLEQLAHEVYRLVRHRLALERERRGQYYSGRLS